MDLSKLKRLRYVSSETSLRKAAKKAGEKYANFRKQLLKLEEDLAIPLFNNEGGKLVLTKQGKDFIKHANNIIQYSENQLQLFYEKERSTNKQLIISTTNANAAQWITDDLADFIKKYTEIQVVVLGSDLPLDKVAYYDVAIRTRTDDPSNLLNQRLISKQAMNLYASEEYINQFGLPATVDDLVNHRLIGFGEDVEYPYSDINWHLNLSAQKVKPFYNINSGLGIFRAVENGIGIGPVSNLGRTISRVPLIQILPEVEGPQVQLYFITDRLSKETDEITELYEFLKKRYVTYHDYSKV